MSESVEVDDFLRRIGNRLMYYSSVYSEFLADSLPNLQITVLKVRRGNELWGIFPVAICRKRVGTVINSLPFFGSHGGPLSFGDIGVQVELMEKFSDLVQEIRPLSATIVENPFELLHEDSVAASGLQIVDDRIGQLTSLPVEADDVKSAVMGMLHGKTRNAVRKGLKLPLEFCESTDDLTWSWMQRVHQESILELGGIPKSNKVFQNLRSAFNEQAQLNVAILNGQPIAGVVSVRYGNSVEYFTPVAEPVHRDTQALSALIYHLMCKFTLEGCDLWNWGGTWRSQEGVYRFKSRWGAQDHPYRYLNRVFDDKILSLSPAERSEHFPNFYLFKY